MVPSFPLLLLLPSTRFDLSWLRRMQTVRSFRTKRARSSSTHPSAVAGPLSTKVVQLCFSQGMVRLPETTAKANLTFSPLEPQLRTFFLLRESRHRWCLLTNSHTSVSSQKTCLNTTPLLHSTQVPSFHLLKNTLYFPFYHYWKLLYYFSGGGGPKKQTHMEVTATPRRRCSVLLEGAEIRARTWSWTPGGPRSTRWSWACRWPSAARASTCGS